jgi:hypothetical protein
MTWEMDSGINANLRCCWACRIGIRKRPFCELNYRLVNEGAFNICFEMGDGDEIILDRLSGALPGGGAGYSPCCGTDEEDAPDCSEPTPKEVCVSHGAEGGDSLLSTGFRRSVLSTTRYPEAVSRMLMSISSRIQPNAKRTRNFAEFFAELRAERAPERPLGSTLLR